MPRTAQEGKLQAMRLRSIPTLVLLGVLVVSSAGCDQIKKAITPAPIVTHVTVAAKVAKPDAKINGTPKEGAPANLPFWEGAGVTHAKLIKADSGDSWLLTLSTPDAFSDVVAGMATGFQDAGWQVESQDASSGETSTTVLTVAGPDAAGVVTIAAQKNKTTQIDYAITDAAK
jgi:hypothetical protein